MCIETKKGHIIICTGYTYTTLRLRVTLLQEGVLHLGFLQYPLMSGNNALFGFLTKKLGLLTSDKNTVALKINIVSKDSIQLFAVLARFFKSSYPKKEQSCSLSIPLLETSFGAVCSPILKG